MPRELNLQGCKMSSDGWRAVHVLSLSFIDREIYSMRSNFYFYLK